MEQNTLKTNSVIQKQQLQSESKENQIEIAPDIFLQKTLETIKQNNEKEIKSQQIYIFKLTSKKLNIIEFTADFSGSENIQLQNRHGLIAITNIEPFSTQIVAKVILLKDWKLKSKFKFSLKPAPKIIQQEYLKEIEISLNKEIIKVTQVLQKYPLGILNLNEVQNIVSQYGFKYIDSEFLPNDKSIYGEIGIKAQQLETLVHWRRPEEFMIKQNDQDQIEIFYDNIEPTDILMGEIDNIGFYSAIACLAERPALIDRLFLSKVYNNDGLYRVKICKNGRWQSVLIDDLLPCYPFAGPIFSKNHGNELWILILEKAYAKLHGGYMNLSKVAAQEALLDLTGCECEYLSIQQQENPEKIDLKYEKQSQSENLNLWEDLIKYDGEGYLLAAAIPLPISLLDQEQDMAAPGQVFSIIQIKQYNNVKLLNIRNPWGNFNWQGDWSDNSELWTPEYRKSFGQPVLDGSDASFWISYQDFCKEFIGVYVCKIKNWNEVRIQGKFTRIEDEKDSNLEVVQSKWYYQIDLKTGTKLIVGVHQEDEKIDGVDIQRPCIDIGIAVFQKLQSNQLKLIALPPIKRHREVHIELVLEPGCYIILPRTTGCSLKKPEIFNIPELKLVTEEEQQFEIQQQYNSAVAQKMKLTPLARSAIDDIFRKYDVLMTRELGYLEFSAFFESIDRKISQREFEQTLLGKYQSTRRGVTLTGFRNFFRDSIVQFGDRTGWKWLNAQGYNYSLQNIRSKNFMLSIHSDSEVQVQVKDAILTDLDKRAHILQVSSDGEEVQIAQYIDGYTYAGLNEQSYDIEVNIDCSKSENALFNSKSGAIRKCIGPQQLEFLMILIKNPENKLAQLRHVMECDWKAYDSINDVHNY